MKIIFNIWKDTTVTNRFRLMLTSTSDLSLKSFLGVRDRLIDLILPT